MLRYDRRKQLSFKFIALNNQDKSDAVTVGVPSIYDLTDSEWNTAVYANIELSNQVQHLDKKELNKSCGET